MTDLETRVEREGNSVHIYKPEGTYTIIYASHTRIVNANVFPSEIDGIFLELVCPYTQRRFQNGFNNVIGQIYSYQEIISLAKKNRIPIYLMDLEDSDSLSSPEKFIKDFQNEKITKKVKTIVGFACYLLSMYAAKFAFHLRKGQGFLATLMPTIENFFPRIFSYNVAFRNTAIAYKQQWLMQQNRAHYATVIGFGHVGIESKIKTPIEQNLTELSQYMHEMMSLFTPETFYSIVRFDYNGRAWKHTKTYEVPELKALIM